MTDFFLSFWEGFVETLAMIAGPVGRFVWPYVTFANLRNLAAWGIACFMGNQLAWNAYQTNGHVTCDFAGQWLMARMFASGRADELYIVGPERQAMAYGYAK